MECSLNNLAGGSAVHLCAHDHSEQGLIDPGDRPTTTRAKGSCASRAYAWE